MKKDLKVAVIGAGSWGINLVRNLHVLGVLSHVVEQSSELLSRAGEEAPEAIPLNDYNPLLGSDVDAVVVVTPAPSHFEIAAEFLKDGKDVFIEKPMALNVADAEELVRIAEANDCILMVGHLLLYQPAIKFIKTFLDEGALGKVYHLHQQRLQLGKVRTVENVACSFGVHDIAVLLYLIGSGPKDIVARGHCGIQSGIEDDIYIHMCFKDGIQAHLHSSWLWPEIQRSLTIIGDKGMLVYDELKQNVTLHRKVIGKDLQKVEDGEEVIFVGADQPLRLEMQHFLDCIRTREVPLSDGYTGVEVVRVIELLSS